MSSDNVYRRKNIFIKKGFQTDFAVKFLVLIVIEALLAIGLFVYLSKGTFVTGYSGSELIVARTGEYFLPTILLANLVIIGLTAAGGFIVLLVVSHRIAGPLYRFEKSMELIGKGDLTYRFNLRSKDQMEEMARGINEFNSRMDSVIAQVKAEISVLNSLLADVRASVGSGDYDRERLEALLADAAARLEELEATANFFKTSGGHGG